MRTYDFRARFCRIVATDIPASRGGKWNYKDHRYGRPGRRCYVRRMTSEMATEAYADAKPGWNPAVVMGPSHSSEGVRSYYLVRCL